MSRAEPRFSVDAQDWIAQAKLRRLGLMTVDSHLRFQQEHGIWFDVLLDGEIVTTRCVEATDVGRRVKLLERVGEPYFKGFTTVERHGDVQFIARHVGSE